MVRKPLPLNILYLLPELNVGGVETHVCALSLGMQAMGHNVTIVSNGGVMVPALKQRGIDHIELPVHRKSALTINNMANRLRKIIIEKNIHIVHAHSRVPAWAGLFATKHLDTAFVITAHGLYAPHMGSRVMAGGDRIICVSGRIMNHMAERLNADRSRMTVVYNGINIDDARAATSSALPRAAIRRELGLPPDSPVIGSIGRLTNTKGLRYLIDAFCQLKKDVPGIKAILVGDGPMKKDLQDRTAELGLADDLLFTGLRSDIFSVFNALDAYVVSSLSEGFPMGCLEAMAARVPIIATRVGGIPEMLEHERTALLAEPKSPEDLTAGVKRILSDRDLATRITDAGYHDVVNRFSESRMISEILKTYYDTIRDKKGYIGPVAGLPRADRPRVLLTLPELRVGGVETHVTDLARGLKEKDYTPIVVSFGGKLVEKLDASGIRHVALPVHSKSPYVMMNMVPLMRKLIADNRIELVHAHSRVPAWICWAALGRRSAHGRHIPFITTCHSTYSVHLGSRVMSLGDHMIAVSRFVERHIRDNFGTPPDKIDVVYNGVSPAIYDQQRSATLNEKYRHLLGIAPHEKVVGMVASLTPRKGYLHFINSAARLLRDFPDTKFLAVGGGPQKDELEARVRELNLTDRFIFLGVRSDVSDLLSLFDVFVLASSSEGLPYVILEAMCMKRPVVTTDVGGIPEAIAHRRNGMLVKPRDEEALASSILEVLADPPLATRLGEAAHQTISTAFNVSTMVDDTEAIYNKLLG